MKISKAKCPRCGNLNYILPSNNPLVDGICISCLNKSLDAAKVEHFVFFCRTYNYPLDLKAYMALYAESKNNVFVRYAELLIDNGKLSYTDKTSDVWPKVEEEWSKLKSYQDLILKLPLVRESFEERAKLKWGYENNFEELLQLENLYINTVKSYNITEPMRLNAIRMACKLSIIMNQLIDQKDAKQIKEFASAYQGFLKIAQIDDVGVVASEGTIKTVADLYNYLESNGFQFNFYDKENKDVVDFTIADIKESIRNEITNATGLDIKLEHMKEVFLNKEETKVSNIAMNKKPITQIMDSEDPLDVIEYDTDTELNAQEVDLTYFEEE